MIIEFVKEAVTSTWRLRRAVILLWIINSLISLVCIAPLAAAVAEGLSSSPIGWELLSKPNDAVLIDLVTLVGRTLQRVGMGMVAVLVLGVFFNIFTLGGIYGRLHALKQGGDGQRFLQGFMGDAGRYFTSSLTLVFWGVLFSAMLFLPIGLIRMAIQRHEDFTVSEHSVVWMRLLGLFLVLVWLSVTRMVLDVARARLFVPGGPSALAALWHALLALRQRPGVALVSYSTVIVTFALLSWGMMYFRVVLSETSIFWVAVATVLGQLAMLLRIGSRVATACVSRAIAQ